MFYYYYVSGDTRKYQCRHGHTKKQNKMNSQMLLFKIRAHNQCYKDWSETLCFFFPKTSVLKYKEKNQISFSFVMFMSCLVSARKNKLYALKNFLYTMETR